MVPPGTGTAALHEVSFTLIAGNALGVIGPSGSGKTSLARALIGVWKPARGTIRLDGATLDQWSSDAFGRFVGYLPQEVELLEGTVAENIARFEEDADPTKLIAAATKAGVHDVILRLPQGYKTQVGRRRRHAFRRATSAHRAGARALRRSVPGDTRRAQFQSRREWRTGIDQRHQRRFAPAAASRS